MTAQNATTGEMKLAVICEYSQQEIAIIKNTVAKNTTDLELAFFLKLAKSCGLNPFTKEIWCYKDSKGNMLTFAGRDGFLAIAQRDPQYNGIRSCDVRANDVFSLDVASGKVEHKINTAERGAIVGAYCLVFRKNAEPTLEWADFKTYNKGYNTWKTHPEEMIKKVAETHALKKAFGISGLYSEEEMGEAISVSSEGGDTQDMGAIHQEILAYTDLQKIRDDIPQWQERMTQFPKAAQDQLKTLICNQISNLTKNANTPKATTGGAPKA